MQGTNKKTLSMTFDQTPDFRYSEALRTLRTNLLFSGSKLKTILLTSTQPNEGKSTVSMDLARVFAESGKKTLLVDADMRKSEVVQVHDIKEDTVGLSQILTGQIPVEEGIYSVAEVPNMDIILAGPYAPNPTELFEDEMCERLFNYIKSLQYDIVIIDTAPIGTVIDAAILTRYADGAALVCEAEVTTRRLLQRAKEQLDRTGIRFLGVILNKVNMSKSCYYSSYYSYHKYGKSYGSYGYGGYGNPAQAGSTDRKG